MQFNFYEWEDAFRKVAGIILLGFLLSGDAQAADLEVCPIGCAYSVIQDAINDSNNGDTISVQSGTYFENVNVTKKLTLRGIGNPVVDANGSGSAITLSADGITLEGFTATGSGNYLAGVKVISGNNTLTGNNASNNFHGFNLEYSSNNMISDNNADSNSYCGIFLSSSDNNTLLVNNASSNENGIRLIFSSNNILGGNDASSNVYYGISVRYDSYNNTLGGNNASSNGIYGFDLIESSNNTLIENSASHNEIGFYLESSGNTLNGNNALNNNYGISLQPSGNNTLINNVMTGNRFNFEINLFGNPYLQYQIDMSNLVDGKPIYYLKDAKDAVFDSSTNAGTFYCIDCFNVTIRDLNLNRNGHGVFFLNTTQSRIQNINASNNEIGISIYSSSNNTLSGNNVSNNYDGIYLEYSNNSTLSYNDASNNDIGIQLFYSGNNMLNENNAYSNNYIGISLISSCNNNTLSRNNASLNNNIGIDLLDSSNNNTLVGNNASLNKEFGIQISYSSNNSIFNNYFGNANNTNDNGNNIWNTTKTRGVNIIGGPYIGGNFWGNPEGTGFSQICADENIDGICDLNYTFSGVDYLPLTIPSGYSYVYGTVLNDSTGIAGAVVSTNTSNATNTDSSGLYSLLVPAGTYNLTASSQPVFYPNSPITVTVAAGTALMQDIELLKKPTGNISGMISSNIEKLTGNISGTVSAK